MDDVDLLDQITKYQERCPVHSFDTFETLGEPTYEVTVAEPATISHEASFEDTAIRPETPPQSPFTRPEMVSC
jgi:hypothetical protein